MVDVDAEHQRRSRAERVREMLEQLYGVGLPYGTDPILATVLDTLGVDDHLGAQAGVVVHEDGLTYDLVAELIRRADSGEGAAGLALPPRLVARMTHAAIAQGLTAPATLLPLGPNAGAWEFDPESDTVAWDQVAGQHLGHPGGAHRVALSVALSAVHPDDRERVARSLERSITTGAPYAERYRGVRPDGAVLLCTSQARVLAAVADVPRLSGVLVAQAVAPAAA